MTPITDFPRCTAYLAGMGIKVQDPEMQDKHFAWLLGDAAFNEGELKNMGAEGMAVAEWGELLPAMESRMAERGNSKRNKPKLSTQQLNQFRGWMTCYGLKGSALKTEKEILEAARSLWIEIPKTADARRAFEVIGKMQKKYRSYVARENLHNVPRKYLAANEGIGATE